MAFFQLSSLTQSPVAQNESAVTPLATIKERRNTKSTGASLQDDSSETMTKSEGFNYTMNDDNDEYVRY